MSAIREQNSIEPIEIESTELEVPTCGSFASGPLEEVGLVESDWLR